MGQTIEDLAGFTTRSLGAPIELLQGNTRQAGTDLGGAFANGIEGVDDVPVVGKYIGPAVASYFGGPLGYAAAEGVQNGVEAARHGAGYGNAALGGLEAGAIGGATSEVGAQLGGALGDVLGSGTSDAASDTAAGVGGSNGGSMVGTPSAVGTPSISSSMGGGSLVSGTGMDGGSSSLLSTGDTANNQFMNGQYGSSLATNTGSSSAGGALGNAASSGSSNGTLSAIGNYLQRPTSQVINNSLSNSSTLNGIGNFFGDNGLGSQLGNSIGNHFAGQTMGNTLGGLVGADASSGTINKIYNNSIPTPSVPSNLPGSEGAMTLPGDLSSLNGLSQDQQLSNIATQGVYGGGVGSQDKQYYLNQLNNSLIAQPGSYAPMSSISPINNSFLSQLGLGGYGNTQDLLSAMQAWQPPST